MFLKNFLLMENRPSGARLGRPRQREYRMLVRGSGGLQQGGDNGNSDVFQV